VHRRRVSPFRQDRHSITRPQASRSAHPVAADGIERQARQVLKRLHSTFSQPRPPLRHWAMIGDGCVGPP
jgi:hypothetical protein